MVISGVSEEERPQNFMAMAPENSKPLHNFLMPCLKWGNQRLLRCMKLNSNGETSSIDRKSSASEVESDGLITRKDSDSEKRRSPKPNTIFENIKKSPLPPIGASGRKSKIENDGDDGIEAIRAKLMFQLRTAADKMKISIPEEGEEEESLAAAAAAAARPWNLRTRRAACKDPNETGGGGSRNEERQQNSNALRTEIPTTKSLRLRGLPTAQGGEKMEMRKFSISLSREEIEEDITKMLGTKPSRRPKKRAKIIRKQLDKTFPGLWLSEITPDSYKVPDFPESKKRLR